VASGDRPGVTLVTVETDRDAGHVAELREQVVQPRCVDRVDHPQPVVADEGVTRPLHLFVGVGDPTNAVRPAVDLTQLGATALQWHTT